MSVSKYKTVGELIDELSKYDRSLPIVGTRYVEFISDAGSDLGSNEEVGIKSVVDLVSRVIIEMDHY